MTNLATHAVLTYGDPRELPPAVKRFLSESTRDQLCLDEFWFDLLLRYSPTEGQRSRIYVVTVNGSEEVECVLFAASASRAGAANGTRKLVSLTNFYTMSFAPIVRADQGRSASAVHALAATILRERPAWDVIELRSLLREATTTADLIRSFRSAGLLIDTYQQFENWFQRLSGMSGESYFKARPAQLRNTVTRKIKRAKREHKVDLEIYRTVQHLQKGMEDYQRIYTRSWKDPEIFPEFIPQLLRACAERGILRLGVLYLDGEPVAAQIWLVTATRGTIYKLAYDERYRQLSVGSILTKLMFDNAIDVDHVAEVDYGVGNEPYKLDWMSERRHIVGLIGFNPRSPRGLLAAARHFAGRLIRRGVAGKDRPAMEHPKARAAPGRDYHDGPRRNITTEDLFESD
jgi:hypothetical protein